MQFQVFLVLKQNWFVMSKNILPSVVCKTKLSVSNRNAHEMTLNHASPRMEGVGIYKTNRSIDANVTKDGPARQEAGVRQIHV